MSKRNPNARPINKGLTKAMLVEYGITNIYWDQENNEWWINRFWYKNNSKEKINKRIPITDASRPHKYTQRKVYPKVSFAYKQNQISIPLARLLYAWFKGDIPDGYVVDHIDNNCQNNSLDNLQILTQEQNLIKRYLDNPNNNRNQWDAIKKNEQKNQD